jgi:hypothetical protein
MEHLEVVLEGVKLLLWVVLIAYLLMRYGENISELLEAVVSRGGTMTLPGGISVGVTAQLKEAMAEASGADADESASVQAGVQIIANEEFRVLARQIYGTSLPERKRVERQIAALAEDLGVEDVMTHASSGKAGERAAAAVALRAQLASSGELADRGDVRDTVSKLLADRHSRVRYRGVQLAGESAALSQEFTEELHDLASADRNTSVRKAAKRAVRQ